MVEAGMDGHRGRLVDYPDDESAVTEGDLAGRDQAEQPAADGHGPPSKSRARSPPVKARSFSDGGGTPSKLSPSPHLFEASRRASKDDSSLHGAQTPVTPRTADFRALSIQVPVRQFTPPPAASNPYLKPPPLSPKLDHSHIYASPTNILPRRSRGLDFSRAATSLHHSTLADQSSPDSSPTIGDRAVAIPGRRGCHGGPEQSSTSLWSIMGSHDKVNASSSLGSAPAVGSDTSTSSDDDDLMDEDMDEAYVTTPMAKASVHMAHTPVGGAFGSPAMSSLMSFQQRQRPRKHPKKKARGPLGLGFNLSAASLSRSPPNSSSRARRESISWQANQLRISGVESEEGAKSQSDADGGSGDGQRNVTRRPVTRRGNLLPKTKTFARIRAALAEESAPADTETRREAEVVKQVRESDVGPEPRFPPPAPESTVPASALSSPNLTNQESADDIAEDDMMGDLASGLSSSFKQHAIKNSRGKSFWDTFSESSSMGGARITPPPAALLPRGSSSGISEDTTMDSPSLAGPSGFAGSQRSGTPGPSAAEITRRINNKRRRDDDLDPVSFKRRAVSPGMSVHNSPILQSPMQRDSGTWGSRPCSTAGEKGGSSAPSETGSMTSTPANPAMGAGGRLNGKGRVGFQGMVDTNDGIMRMSIE